MPQRKRGGQPGNTNAQKHGRFSARRKAARRAAWDAQCEERRRTEAEWTAKMPKTDYAAICAAIEASKAVKH